MVDYECEDLLFVFVVIASAAAVAVVAVILFLILVFFLFFRKVVLDGFVEGRVAVCSSLPAVEGSGLVDDFVSLVL